MVIRRQNLMLTSGVTLLQMAVSGLISKDSQKQLTKTIKGLADG